MTQYVLDARTATPSFPGIGRYVGNLARAVVPLLAAEERLTILCDPACPIALPPSESAQAVPLAISPFSLRQQWLLPHLLRRLARNGPWAMDHESSHGKVTHSSAIHGLSSIVPRPSHGEAARSSVVYHSPYIAMPYLPGTPTLLTVYDLIPLRYPAHSSARARLFVRWMTRLALRAAQHVVAISEFTRNDFMVEFGLSPERITAIPLAADPIFSPQSPEAIAELRARYGLPEQFILYLGSNKPHKNLVRLVEAWHVANGRWQMARGRTQTADRRLVIAGAWSDRYPEARELADSLAAERPDPTAQLPTSGFQPPVWLGPVRESDLPALYSAATAFVFPSLCEGFGLPVLEAMACGTPVICSDASSLPEVTGQTVETQRRNGKLHRIRDANTQITMEEPGQSGQFASSASHSSGQAAAILVDPTDTGTLAEAIARLMADEALRRSLAQRGQEQAARFSWERTAEATLSLYRWLAAARP